MTGDARRIADLEATVARLEAVVAGLTDQLEVRDARIVELEGQLAEVRRSGKRQAAPFSKGDPSTDPGRPGHKKGKGHGRHGHRRNPVKVDRTVDALLPGCCPHCGDNVAFLRWADQFQTELPPVAPVVTRFRVGVGRCRGCSRRVQGRHPEQSSDALGAAGAQVGPRAKAMATWLHYGLGLSFARSATVLARFGIDVTPGALCSSAASTGTALVPTTKAITAHLRSAPSVKTRSPTPPTSASSSTSPTNEGRCSPSSPCPASTPRTGGASKRSVPPS